MATSVLAAAVLLFSVLVIPTQGQDCSPLPCFGCSDTGSAITITCAGGGLTSFPSLPDDVQPRVDELVLRSNQITELTTADLVNYTILETLDLSFNNLSSIEFGSFGSNVNLEELDLSNNRLTHISENLFENTSLTTLVLSNNLLRSITADTFNGLQFFPIINLGNNIFESLPSDLFSSLPSRIAELILVGNPLVCDCHLRWLFSFLADTNQQPLVSDIGFCEAPVFNNTIVAVSSIADAEDFGCTCEPQCVNGACNTTVGECECAAGYHGDNCSLECPEGYYGDDCAGVCACENGASCNHITGECNCTAGWRGEACNEACPDGYYGDGCQACMCENGASCDHISGDCDCTAGWTGLLCDEKCPEGYYGDDCAGVCACENGASCYHITGECNCTAGWRGEACNEACLEGYYGDGCQACMCENEASCDHIIGDCDCTAGWTGLLCDDECPEGYYGDDCAGVCACENVARCDHITGECNCPAGWTGEACSEECEEGTYGPDCIHDCECRTRVESCNRFNGTCTCKMDPPDCEVYTTQPNTNTNPSTAIVTPSDSTPGATASSPALSTGATLAIIVGVTAAVFVVLVAVIVILGIGTRLLKKKMRISPSYSTPGGALIQSESHDVEGGTSRRSSGVCPTAPPQTFCRADHPPSYEEVVTHNIGVNAKDFEHSTTKKINMREALVLLVVACLVKSVFSQDCPEGCFGCNGVSTSRVICSNAGLTSFPLFPVDVQQNVEELNLQANNFSVLARDDLQNYTSLTALDLSFIGLRVIEEGSFTNTTALEELELDGNLLTEIPDNLFEFTQLTTLNLLQNNIGNISAATFIGVQSFGTINLQDNVIRTIPDDTFSALGRLSELNLGGNPLRCDCELRWFPEFLADTSTSPLLPLEATCNFPLNLNGQNIRDFSVDDFLCNCSPMCVNGSCDMSVGECVCEDGYIGNDCSTECSVGSYGTGCQNMCSCVTEHESRPCNHVDGSCTCRPGYTGASCQLECPEGYYGQDCLEECGCQNGADCDFISGFCNCTIGYMGMFCDQICPPLLYGQDCSLTCSCTTGNCHHITGECACPIGYFGTNCNHNCTEVPNCVSVGREECSLLTPEQTCGACLQGHVGAAGTGNNECIQCSGSPDCGALNREPCNQVENTCGPCFPRHLGETGYSNESCFDPCIDGVLNYDETDIDCGGLLCPSCQLGDECTLSDDCGDRSVCLGVYLHPSGISYPIDPRDNNTCVGDTSVGESVLSRFKAALQGRIEPLANVNPFFTQYELEQEVGEEIISQFEVGGPLRSVVISELKQGPGELLYQTYVEVQGSPENSFSRMIENIHNGKLKGTLLLNEKDKKALFNF
ncbi:uncharacterized protein LOC135340207 [Halichondria panicea]|uniref:uncharacterized protein LOC135340207 n=1 Tax=Halichondria panicea TaxID=6063 RepID=UPI00312B8A77